MRKHEDHNAVGVRLWMTPMPALDNRRSVAVLWRGGVAGPRARTAAPPLTAWAIWLPFA